MKGMRVKYRAGMIGTIVESDATHVVIKLDSGTTYCVLKSSIEPHDFFYCQRQIEGLSVCDEQCEHCREYYAPVQKKYHK